MDVTDAFSPLSLAQAEAELDLLLHDSPRAHGIAQTRWRLADMAQCLGWLTGCSPGSVCHQLQRLRFSRKQLARFHRSPDPEYAAKQAAIAAAYAQVQADPLQYRLVYFDEFTYYRHATLKPLYQRRGRRVRRLVEPAGANTKTRIAAALDPLDGSVYSVQGSHFGIREMRRFLKAWAAAMRQRYPHLTHLWLVLDNWPVHHHAEIRLRAAECGITLLYLPTYASWLNPIERLWRWLRQDVLHLHPFAGALKTLRSLTREWMAQRSAPSPLTLLRTGLLSQGAFATRHAPPT